MSEQVKTRQQKANTPQEATQGHALLQRRNSHQPESTTQPERRLDAASGTFAAPRLSYDFSRVPALTGIVRQTQPLNHDLTRNEDENATRPLIDSEVGSPGLSTAAEPAAEKAPPVHETATITTEAESTAKTPGPEEIATPQHIVEDSAETVRSEQMQKSEFLAQLRAEVTREAEAALEGTGRTTAQCPYLDYWFGHYSRQDSLHLERAIHRYAPETAYATTAKDYIPIIAERVRRSVETWAGTGEIAGIPEGLSMGTLGGIGGLISGIGNIFSKSRNGGVRAPDDPRVVQAELGQGRPLEGALRARMESAFGRDFAHVRTHTDATAAELSNRFNARAFTVGKDIAFGSGEYKPGTLVGDALIAHELAHVVQQKGAADSVAPMQTVAGGTNALEEDADKSAAGIVASLWGDAKERLTGIAKQTAPRLKSGLKLQRCSVFSELSSQRYMGYDDSITPNGLVVPVGSTRDVQLRKSDDTMTIESDDPGVATVAEENEIMTVTGVAHGTAMVSANEGTETVEQLDVSVKKQIDKTVHYHYMSDNAGHSTSRSPGNETGLTNTLNRVWERQANIHFKTGTVDSKQVTSDLGDRVLWTPGPNNEWDTIAAFATGSKNDLNVFLVWEYGEDANAARLGSNVMLEDDDCSDGLTIAHEAGHFLGLYTGGTPHPGRGVMSRCGGTDRERVTKAEADIVNP